MEHPILFAGPMVRAFLDGRKTQTRRGIKRQPEYWPETMSDTKWPTTPGTWRACPYGIPGDHLWVRETWMKAEPNSPYSTALRKTVYKTDEDAEEWAKWYK